MAAISLQALMRHHSQRAMKSGPVPAPIWSSSPKPPRAVSMKRVSNPAAAIRRTVATRATATDSEAPAAGRKNRRYTSSTT